MSVPSLVVKGYPMDLSLSGARVAMVDPLHHYRNIKQRRSSFVSTGSSSPSDNRNDMHTCSTVNSRLLANTRKLPGTAEPSDGILHCRDGSTTHSEGSGYRVHLRNIPNGIVPISHHYTPFNNENLTTDSSLQEAQIIRKALQFDRFKTVQSSPTMEILNEYDILPSRSQPSLCDTFQSPDSRLDIGNVHSPSVWTKTDMAETVTQSPITPPSHKSLPLRSLPNCTSVLGSNNVCNLRRNSSMDEDVSGLKGNSLVLDSKLSREATTEEVLNELIEETREKIAALQTKKRKDKKKKKKRQDTRSVSQLGSKRRKSSAGGKVPQATSMSAGKPYEASTLQAFCKPMAVLASKPDKTRPKYNPLQSGAWAPSKQTPGTQPSSNSKFQAIVHNVPNSNAAIHSVSEIRISPRKSIDIGVLRKTYGSSKGVDDGAFHKVIKVFLSEKQSGMLKELGVEFPCAPPATPTPDLLKRYEYVPSMNDCRAQRAFKIRLEAMEKMEKKKIEKLREEKAKQDKVNLKERERAYRKRQRLQIYALNKIMTEFENKNFLEFCKANGMNPSER